MDWITYWNGTPSVYVSRRHKEAHYRAVADGIAALVEHRDAKVVDFGCGEALAADRLALHCGHLYLSDGAETVRAGLAARFANFPTISVLGETGMAELDDASVDLVVVNSVVQYLSRDDLEGLVRDWRRVLAANGRLVFADIIPPDLGASDDAIELLKFARANGFLLQAVTGLVRTALSDYRKLRAALGLAKYSEDAFIALMREHGLAASRIRPNLGHNQRRMAFDARPI